MMSTSTWPAKVGASPRRVAEYMPFIRQVLDGVITVHHGHMPEITLTSPTTATGIWALEDQLWWPEGSPDLRICTPSGTTTRPMSSQAAAWYIKTMTLTRLHRLFTTPA